MVVDPNQQQVQVDWGQPTPTLLPLSFSSINSCVPLFPSPPPITIAIVPCLFALHKTNVIIACSIAADQVERLAKYKYIRTAHTS
jgi:hypothetical protein